MALLIITGIVLVVLIILLFVGFKWVDPESLRLKVYNWLEFEMRGKEPSRIAQTRHQALVILIALVWLFRLDKCKTR